MHKYRIHGVWAIPFVALVACSPEVSEPSAVAEPLDHYTLEFRDGFAYLPGQQTPFSGHSQSRYESGEQASLRDYHHGQLTRYQQWDRNGNTLHQLQIEDGSLVGRNFWTNSDTTKTTSYREFSVRDGFLHGEVIDSYSKDFENEQVSYRAETNYLNGYPVSAMIVHINNGDMYSETVSFSYVDDSDEVKKLTRVTQASGEGRSIETLSKAQLRVRIHIDGAVFYQNDAAFELETGLPVDVSTELAAR